MAMYRTALAQARIASDNLNASKQRLQRTSVQLTGQFGILTNRTRAFRVASLAAANASLTFRAAALGLWNALNPLGILLGIGIGLLIEYAFREDAAAGAADRMAEAQNRLSRFIDFTTGKIIEQNQALIENEILTEKKNAATARENWQDVRERALRTSRGQGLSLTTLPTDPRIRKIVEDYEAGRFNAEGAARRLGRIENLEGSPAMIRDRLIADFSQLTTLAQEGAQAASGARILRGQGTAEDRRRVQGNFTGEDIDLTNRMANAEDGVAASRKKSGRATDEAAEAERKLVEARERSDKIADILSRYDEAPRAVDRAERDKRELDQLIGKSIELRDAFGEALGTGLYTQEMANADRARIDYGLRKPIRDAIAEQQRGIELSRLRLEGYDLEVTALEQALSLQESSADVTREDLQTLVDNARLQQEINDKLAMRERLVGQILEVAETTRSAFEDMLVGLTSDPLNAVKNFGKTLLADITRISARQITERLFAGADAKLRELVTGARGVDRAAEILAEHVRTAADSTVELASANDNLASATEHAADRINAAADRISAGGIEGLAAPTPGAATEAATHAARAAAQATQAVQAVTGGAPGGLAAILKDGAIPTSLAGLAEVAKSWGAAGSGQSKDAISEIITVTGARARGGAAGPLPSGAAAYNTVFERLGAKLDATFKSGTFFAGIGKGVGKGLQGAAEGQLASAVLGLTGLKQSRTGAAIGGAIGAFLPIPGGSFIGGAIGGTIGGLFKKTKSGSSTIGFDASGMAIAGSATGSNADYRRTATGLAGSVADRLNQVATALGAVISGGAAGISIGQRKDKFTVDPTGRNRTKGSGVLKFDTEEEAAQYAFQRMLETVVLGGISAASQNIIRAGSKNIDLAIQKALAIESIPKRLLEKTDPVRFAVEQLNEEFTKLISYLKEGGATTAQFADAQKLYELERAEAIEQASQRSTAAIQAFLDEMIGGSGSPFNKRTTYQNAAAKLNTFRADITAGKMVDQEDLLAAARNFQDASRALNGSSTSFFTDFNDLFALLSRARDNSGTGTGALPGSPFSSADIQQLLGSQVQATNDQTYELGTKLDVIANLLMGGQYPGSSIGYLPGFQVAA
jgi:hypothetical protein